MQRLQYMMRNFGTPGLANKEFGFDALVTHSHGPIPTPTPEKDVKGFGSECVRSPRRYRCVWMSLFFMGPCEWARSAQDRVLWDGTYDAGGLLQVVAPDVNVRQGRVELHAVREGAQSFTADLIGH